MSKMVKFLRLSTPEMYLELGDMTAFGGAVSVPAINIALRSRFGRGQKGEFA
jgi:hypothetical protein